MLSYNNLKDAFQSPLLSISWKFFNCAKNTQLVFNASIKYLKRPLSLSSKFPKSSQLFKNTYSNLISSLCRQVLHKTKQIP